MAFQSCQILPFLIKTGKYSKPPKMCSVEVKRKNAKSVELNAPKIDFLGFLKCFRFSIPDFKIVIF